MAVVEAKRQYALGHLQEILGPHPRRVSPPCPWFGACGGCQLQHADKILQTELKGALVQDALTRLGEEFPRQGLKPVVKLCPLGIPEQAAFRRLSLRGLGWDSTVKEAIASYPSPMSVVDLAWKAFLSPAPPAGKRCPDGVRQKPPETCATWCYGGEFARITWRACWWCGLPFPRR